MNNDNLANNAFTLAFQQQQKIQQDMIDNARRVETWSMERQQTDASVESAKQLSKQTQQQSEMIKATFAMVEEQRKANEAQQQSNIILQEQLDFLKEQNEAQARELKRNKTFQWASWTITSSIAIVAIILPIILKFV